MSQAKKHLQKDLHRAIIANVLKETSNSHFAELCKGSTNDSDSFSPGSNPGSAAKHAAMVKRLRRRPLTAKTGVRVPVAVPKP